MITNWEEADEKINETIDFLEEGRKVSVNEELLEIARARMKNKKVQDGLFMTQEDLRFATNYLVAKYRAKRLACDTLAEIGCSIGAQTMEFAKTCKKVIAMDIDKRKVGYASLNFKKFDINNVELICADGLKIDIKKADAIFCDTERAPEEKKRTIDALKPNVHELMKKHSAVTKNFCIEIPPQTRDIDIDCEKEYVSINGELNRLNIYTGELKSAKNSAVVLPSFDRVEGEPKETQLASTQALSYLYEIDEAVAKAQLVDAMAVLLKAEITLFKEDHRFLTSNEKIESPFFKSSFKTVTVADNKDDAIEALRKKKYGKVVLRQNLDPKMYWSERNSYERNLAGNKIAYLIASPGYYVICERISSPDPEIS